MSRGALHAKYGEEVKCVSDGSKFKPECVVEGRHEQKGPRYSSNRLGLRNCKIR